MKNFRKFTLIFFGLMYSIYVFNQESKMSIGVEISPTNVDLYGDGAMFHDPRFSISTGISFDYQISEIVALKTGLNWDRKGSQLNEETFDTNGDLTIEITETNYYDYLVIPVLASISNNKKNFYINTGPFLGYLISQKDKYEETGNSTEITNDIENSNRLDFGWNFGLGYMHSITKKLVLEVGVETDLGFLNTSKNSMGAIKTRSINLHIGIKHKF